MDFRLQPFHSLSVPLLSLPGNYFGLHTQTLILTTFFVDLFEDLRVYIQYATCWQTDWTPGLLPCYSRAIFGDAKMVTDDRHTTSQTFEHTLLIECIYFHFHDY